MRQLRIYGVDERAVGRKPPIDCTGFIPYHRYTTIIIICSHGDDDFGYNDKRYVYTCTSDGKTIISERRYDRPEHLIDDLHILLDTISVPAKNKRVGRHIFPLWILYLGLKTQTEEDFLV